MGIGLYDNIGTDYSAGRQPELSWARVMPTWKVELGSTDRDHSLAETVWTMDIDSSWHGTSTTHNGTHLRVVWFNERRT